MDQCEDGGAGSNPAVHKMRIKTVRNKTPAPNLAPPVICTGSGVPRVMGGASFWGGGF